jgi:hypothetical protein
MKRTELAANPRTGRRFTRCVPSGKVRFESMQSAERMMAQMVLDRRAKYAPCRAYRCDECGGWHLTSQPRVKPY